MSALAASAAVEGCVALRAPVNVPHPGGVTSGATRRPYLVAGIRRLVNRLPRPAIPTTPTRIPGGRQ